MNQELDQMVARHDVGISIFKMGGDVAPAFGMIGTLIGLVQMLSAMEDPSAIGPAMAIALLTTLYGAFMANVFFLPIADKLAFRSSKSCCSQADARWDLSHRSAARRTQTNSRPCWAPTLRPRSVSSWSSD